LPQERTIDMRADLTGVETEWRDSSERWTGWLPHLDSGVAQNLTRASAEHQRLFELMRHPGTLKMRAQLDLWLMLHPVTQPGSTLDFEYPPETVTLVFTTSAGHTVTASRDATIEKRSDRETWITTKPVQDRWLSLEISVTTGSGETPVRLAWHTADDLRPRALPLRRILAPWATPKPDDSPAKEREIPEIAGGNWARGKTLFFSEQAACYKCHQIGGEGGKIGPDLSNLVHRDYASVLKDITLPSAAINPDHLAYNVELKNGDVQNGVILSDSPDELTLGLVDGKTLRVARSSIAAVKPSAISLMPENLLQGLSPLAQKDLFTFLLSTPPRLTAAGK